MTPDLMDHEINQTCQGLVQNCAKVRFLESLGLTVRKKPDGSPLVNRAHYNRIMGDGTAPPENDSNGPRWGVH